PISFAPQVDCLTTSRRRSTIPASSASSLRGARTPLLIAATTRSKPRPLASSQVGHRQRYKPCARLQESNASRPPQTHSRNTRSKFAPALAPTSPREQEQSAATSAKFRRNRATKSPCPIRDPRSDNAIAHCRSARRAKQSLRLLEAS